MGEFVLNKEITDTMAEVIHGLHTPSGWRIDFIGTHPEEEPHLRHRHSIDLPDPEFTEHGVQWDRIPVWQVTTKTRINWDIIVWSGDFEVCRMQVSTHAGSITIDFPEPWEISVTGKV